MQIQNVDLIIAVHICNLAAAQSPMWSPYRNSKLLLQDLHIYDNYLYQRFL